MRWSSQGSYDSRTGLVREDVSVISYNATATVTTTLSCPSDPWLGPNLGPGTVVCANPTFRTSGGNDVTSPWSLYLQEGFYSTAPDLQKPSPLPNSTGFAYDRAKLIAQRDDVAQAEAQAEAHARAREEQARNSRLSKGIQKMPRVAPIIQLPAANALFLEYSTVPIKLQPPQGFATTSLLVKLERLNPQGQWAIVTHLPLSIAEATSPSGYTGWGAGGNGRSGQMVATPGTYRVSAQVSYPKKTVWSLPVQFVVITPNKAIQKGPKLFGQ